MARSYGGPVRAVFFDVDDTLSGYDPPLEVTLVGACQDFGLDITARQARQGWLAGGHYFRRSVAQLPILGRTETQIKALHMEFDRRILVGAGLKVDGRLAYRVFTRLLELLEGVVTARTRYDDALPALTALKAAGLTLGVISNISVGLEKVCHDLGLTPWMDIIVGPEVAGCSKPDPRIFRTALRLAGVPPRAAVHVGDNPVLDAAGAKRAGLRAVLLDRYGACEDAEGVARARSLEEVFNQLSLVPS